MFEIGIPTINRYDLLQPSLLMYGHDFANTKIWVLDNGKQGIHSNNKNVSILTETENIGVAASWNKLCDLIFDNPKNDCALILNDDIYLGKREVDIHSLIDKKRNRQSFLRCTPDWCVFLISREVYKKVGKFDECFFPAYYEDKSYEYRMKMLNLPQIVTPLLNPYIYQNSMTAEKMPSIIDVSKKNKQLYIEMWGGEPNKEKFKKAFNK